MVVHEATLYTTISMHNVHHYKSTRDLMYYYSRRPQLSCAMVYTPIIRLYICTHHTGVMHISSMAIVLDM